MPEVLACFYYIWYTGFLLVGRAHERWFGRKDNSYKNIHNMKYLMLSIFSLFALLSCEKTAVVPSEDIPKWLEDRIEKTEAEIHTDPKSLMGFTAWIRYEFQNEVYYENDIPYSSYYPHLYDKNGKPLSGSSFPVDEYLSKKCYKQIIWKGPDYY